MNPQNNITQEEWDVIEAYLEQKSVVDKKVLWDKKLTQIPDVEEKIAHISKVREEIEDSIKKSKIKDFHTYISETEKDASLKNSSSKVSRTIWYTAAAVLVILFGIFWMLKRDSASERIFAENFKPDIGLPLKMGTLNNVAFYEGMVAYKRENYKGAIEQWEVLWKDDQENDTLTYFLGVANLAEGNAKQSLKYLQNQESFRQSVFKEDAAYYAALAKIKEGKSEEAKRLLKNNPSTRNNTLMDLLR